MGSHPVRRYVTTAVITNAVPESAGPLRELYRVVEVETIGRNNSPKKNLERLVKEYGEGNVTVINVKGEVIPQPSLITEVA